MAMSRSIGACATPDDHCGASPTGALARRAPQRPSTQRQAPPQSSVPPRQSIVHITSPQLGAAARAVHAAGWQHPSGTQSASVAHGASLMTIGPEGVSGAVSSSPALVGVVEAAGAGAGSFELEPQPTIVVVREAKRARSRVERMARV